MSRPKAADEHVGANWAAVKFAHKVEVARRRRDADAAMHDGGVGSLLGVPIRARRRAQKPAGLS